MPRRRLGQLQDGRIYWVTNSMALEQDCLSSMPGSAPQGALWSYLSHLTSLGLSFPNFEMGLLPYSIMVGVP